MDKSYYYYTKYKKLSFEERYDLLLGLADKYGMSFKGYTAYGNKNNHIDTGIYEKDNREFIFIPGKKNVKLGYKLYDYNFSPMTKAFIAMELINIIKSEFSVNNGFLYSEIRELKAKYDKISNNQHEIVKFSASLVDEFLLRKTTHSTIVDISPMLVERFSDEIQWIKHKEILLDDIVNQMKYFKIYKDMVQSKKNVIYDESFIGTKDGFKNSKKYVLEEDRLVEFHYKSYNHENFIYNTTIEGYSIPTDLEWQYLALGAINPIIAFEDINLKSLNNPNYFGLVIANDVYKPEIVSDNPNIVKGGDNGYYLKNYPNIAYLPLSPAINSKPEVLRDIYARRIIRVNSSERYKPNLRPSSVNKYIISHDIEKHADEIIYVYHHYNKHVTDIESIIKVLKVFNSKGMYNKIIETLDDKALYKHSDATFLYIVGNAYFKTNKFDMAILYLRKAISIKRNYPNCYQILAHAYKQENMIEEMKQALHYVKLIRPKIAKDIIISLMPERLSIKDKDLTDYWEDFVKDYLFSLELSSNKDISNLYLLNLIIRHMIEEGAEEYLKMMDEDGFQLAINIIEEIENSKYVHNSNFLSPEDLDEALNYTYICKDTLKSIHNLANKPVDSKVLQDLTNIFFDYVDGLIALAYIHFLNSQIFEADTVFDEDYIFLQTLYKNNKIDHSILDQVTLIFVDLINDLNTKLISYGELLNLFNDSIDKIANIKRKHKKTMVANDVLIIFVEAILKDIRSILKHYNLKIDYHDIINRIK